MTLEQLKNGNSIIEKINHQKLILLNCNSAKKYLKDWELHGTRTNLFLLGGNQDLVFEIDENSFIGAIESAIKVAERKIEALNFELQSL